MPRPSRANGYRTRLPDHAFYGEDGAEALEPTAENLAGHRFARASADRMVMQASGDDGDGKPDLVFAAAFFIAILLAVAAAAFYRPE